MRHLTPIAAATLCATLLAAALLTAPAASAQQPERFSADFQSEPLGQVLEALRLHDPGLAYTLPDDAADRPVTVTLVDVTAAEALSAVLAQAGLQHQLHDGTYVISQRPAAEPFAAPTTPTYGAPVFTTRPAVPAAAAGTTDADARGEQVADLPVRVLQVKHANPALIAELFGGHAIYGDETGTTGGTIGTTARTGGTIGTTARPGGTIGTTARPGGGYGGGYGQGGGGRWRATGP